jgi:hypothetical protein
LWDDTRKIASAELKAGVCVDLNKPDLELVIYHKVVTEDFERVEASSRVNLAASSTEGICD